MRDHDTVQPMKELGDRELLEPSANQRAVMRDHDTVQPMTELRSLGNAEVQTAANIAPERPSASETGNSAVSTTSQDIVNNSVSTTSQNINNRPQDTREITTATSTQGYSAVRSEVSVG
jgi:hypothetical protein